MSNRRFLAFGLLAGAAGGLWWAARPAGEDWIGRRSDPKAAALVTGASSGIGAEFARQLAHAGYHLVLVARRQDRLAALAEELRAAHGISVTVLPADLSTPAGVDTVAAAIAELESLEILVNNAGFGTTHRFAKSEPERQREMVYLHADAVSALTHAALQGMLRRRRGAVVSVSSVAAFLTMRGNVNYCATKRYINHFTEGLALDLKDSGVVVQALCPGLTMTEFHSTSEFAQTDQRRLPSMLWMSASDVVAASLAALGSGQVIVVPGLHYRLAVALLQTPLVGTLIMRLAELGRPRRR